MKENDERVNVSVIEYYLNAGCPVVCLLLR